MATVVGLGRPVHWELGQGVPPGPLHPGVPLFGVQSEPLAAPAGMIDRAFARLYALSLSPGARDRSARRVYAASATGLGRYAYGRGDLGRAGWLFDTALGLRPHHTAAHLNRAIVFARQRDYAQAIRHGEAILAQDPNHVQALINLARWHLRSKRDQRAVEFLDRALELDNNQASAWSLAALIDLRAGNVIRAQQRVQRAVAIDPRNRDLQDLLRQIRKK